MLLYWVDSTPKCHLLWPSSPCASCLTQAPPDPAEKTHLQSCALPCTLLAKLDLLSHSHLATGPNEEFGLRLANRSFLVLRGQYGYVGTSTCHDVLQCNLLDPDCIELLPCKHGIYHLQSKEGRRVGEGVLFAL